MICPECRKEMTRHVESAFVTSPFDDKEISENIVIYKCDKCDIKLKDGKWEIPDAKKASEKQIKAAQFIENTIGVRAPPPTKKGLWTFVNKFFDKAKNAKTKKDTVEETTYQMFLDSDYYSDELPF